MSKRYGIVYMGSKEKILDLINYIFEREYEKETFIDLFTGGFSVSSYALQRTNFNVIANDLNGYVIDLYKEIMSGGKNLAKVRFDWVDRETFEDVRDNPNNYAKWYVGFVLNVYSFGCNQKDYLYAKDLEEDKRAIHEAIVNNNFTLINQNPLFKGLYIPDNIKKLDFYKYPLKRLTFMSHFKTFVNILEQEQDPRFIQARRLIMTEHLLQSLHINAIVNNVKHTDRLELLNFDWKEAYNKIPKEILENAFIYCDPPYEDTKQYQFGQDFDYIDFWEWFLKCPYPVYVSSYIAPADIKPINFTHKRVLLDNGNLNEKREVKGKKAVENIYWNGKGNPTPTMLDLLFGE